MNAAPPADSDYGNAKTFKYVSERSLNQFDVLNTIFNAMAQTHYDDPSNLNQPAYAAMVTWEDKGDQGQLEKRLVRWVVESTRASANDPNVVKAWFRMPMKDNQMFTIQARVEITQAPAQASDGSYLDYGVWSMNVKVEEAFPFRFVASAERDAQGRAVIKMSQSEPTGGPSPAVTRGILVRSAQAGSGKVTYPDWDLCQSPSCVPQESQVVYVYDPQVVTLQKNQGTTTTKSRNAFVDVVNRYGLYDGVTGDDVSRTRHFGFPIRATVGGSEVFGYYGAWQGRHQLWANGASLPGGLTVQRADVPPNQVALQYTTSDPFAGILVKRTYAPAQLSDLAGLVVETWDNRNFQLFFDGTRWCTDPVTAPPPGPQPGPPTASCGPSSATFSDWASLEVSPSDVKRSVSIGTWDTVQQRPLNFVYEGSGPGGPGLYEALMSPSSPHPTRIGTSPYAFAAGTSLWVNVGGSIFITYDGTGWFRKTVVAFDQQTWTPTFAPDGDSPYTLEAGREYYFNNSGTSYIAKVEGGVTVVRLEIQTVANPANASTLVPSTTVFTEQWCGATSCSTYGFASDPAGASFMKLYYRTVSDADANAGKVVGGVVDSGRYGLQASIGDNVVQFNWDYPQQGQNCGGIQQFLLSAPGAYVMLDDPIRLGSLTLTNAADVTRNFTLQFDGNWMQGLPNVWDDLMKSGFEATQAIQQKNFSIPSGTEIGAYVVKQLQVSEYMASSSAAPLDLAAALAVDLSTIPSFVDPGMGSMPEAALKYSEGKPVSSP